MAVTRTAVNSPAVQISTAHSRLIDAYNSASGTAPASKSFSAGETTTVRQKLNENSLREDYLSRFGGGVRCIGVGLALTAVGTAGTVAAGIALIDGLVEIQSATATPALTDNSWNFVWLRQSGTIVVSTTTTPPNSDTVFLGAVQLTAGTAGTPDTSGVVYARGGLRFRETSDAGAPGDSPTAPVFTKTAGGFYLWDGAAHQQAGVAGATFYYGTAARTSGDATVHDSYAPGGGVHWTATDRTNFSGALTDITALEGDVSDLQTDVAPLDTSLASTGQVLVVPATPGDPAEWADLPLHASEHATGQPDEITPADIGASAVGHLHAGTDITSGTIPAARLPAATTSAAGAVELATDGEVASNVVVQGNDSRLSNARVPSGSAGGDISGTYPSTLTVAKIQGRAMASTAPTDGQAIVWDNAGSTWKPGTIGGSDSATRIFAAIHGPGSPTTWTNMPSAATELFGDDFLRTYVDATGMVTARIVANIQTAGVADAYLKAQYSITDGSSWVDLGESEQVAVLVDATGTVKSGWKTIPSAARTEILLRVVGVDGDGAVDPVFGHISIQFRVSGIGTSEAEEPSI